MSADVLSQRLRELEQDKIVRRDTLAPPAGSRVYELTDRGQELEPVVLALGRWGSGAPFPPRRREARHRLDGDRTDDHIRSRCRRRPRRDLELRLDGQRFRARVAGGRFEVARGEEPEPDATIETDPGTLAAMLWHGRSLADGLRSGRSRSAAANRRSRASCDSSRCPTPTTDDRAGGRYSHSIVEGGFEEMSSVTRLTWRISLMIRLETRSRRS